MKKRDTIAINTHFINNRIKELGLKRSWLSEKIGVDKKTISRWTTGKVKRIAIYNAEALAKCLKTTVEELSEKTDIHVLGTQLDKELAAKEIISEDLLQLLSPTGNWRLIETIIKSTITPNLSKDKIGRLYNWLSITKWRMKNYEDAKVFAEKALQIGAQIDDKAIIVKALFNLGTIDSLIGKNDAALDCYLKCCELKEHFENSRDLASLYTNISMVYRDMANFNESLHYQKEAIELFSMDIKHYNLSIAYQCLGYIYTETGQFDKAIQNLDIAINYAQKSNNQSALVIIPLYKLDALALSNRFDDINDDIKLNIDKFINGEYNDPFCFEYIVRYYRLISNIIKAEEVIGLGIKKANHNPTAMASLWHEKARLSLYKNDFEAEKLYRERGNEIYKSTALNKRVIEREILEYGKVFLEFE